MRDFPAACRAELLKAHRSRAPWVSAAGLALAPLVGGGFMYILQDPARARSMGLLGNKSQLLQGSADWPTYFGLLAQATAVGGVAVFALVFVWMFGREFADRTLKDLLALPTSRVTVVAAKFAVASVWCLALCAQTYALGLAIGAALALPGWSPALAAGAAGRLVATGAMTIALVAPFAFAASAGRGYLTAVGLVLLMVFASQIIILIGYGAYFPWSVPGLYSGAAGPGQPPLGPVSFVLVALAGAAGIAGTAAWWQYADHDQ
jgi:ABC-2 type transport system permease protein